MWLKEKSKDFYINRPTRQKLFQVVKKSSILIKYIDNMKIENIKFKAKRLDNQEWVEGNLRTSKSGNAMIIPIEYSGAYPVEPSTVCQFTGLTDCENQDIYEGDILAEKEHPEFEVGYIDCTFAAAYVGDDRFIFNLLALSEACKVCGNKFDRKEGE